MENDIAVATVSWIRTKEESKIVLKTINYLSNLDIPLIIVDGGSSKKEQKKIRKIPNVIFFEKKELTEQLLTSHREAAKLAKHIFYLHTDKLDFAKNTAGRMIDYFRSLDKKGLLIPTRNSQSIATYPHFQRKIEDFLNFFISEYIGIKNDYFAGPKIYPSSIVHYFDYLSGKIGWGIESYIYVLVKRMGMKFDFFPFFMNAPEDIDNERETRLYRMNIVNWQIEGYLQAQQVEI